MRKQWKTTLNTQVERYGLKAVDEPKKYDAAKVALGRALFFDPILSGNKDAACSTCHMLDRGLSNGVPLAAGTRAVLVDGHRTPGPRKSFTPRNVPDLFNRDQDAITTMFWDNRLGRSEDDRVVLYDKAEARRADAYLQVMDDRLDSMIAAQTMLPVLNRDELRGHVGDEDVFGQLNKIAQIGDPDFVSSWRLLFEQVWAVDAYKQLIKKAYPDVMSDKLSFVHLANALGAFIASTFTFTDSPWDQFLAGDEDALTDEQLHGATIFFGSKAMCGTCHLGPLLSDQKVHNIGIRPMTSGPDFERGIDLGAQHRSLYGEEGRFAFRTPMLRNVELTAPYMHNGLYNSLEAVIEHKNHAERAFWLYDATALELPYRPHVHQDSARILPVTQSLAAPMQNPLDLSEKEKSALISFLKALTSPSARDLTQVAPDKTLSGLERLP